MLSVSTAFSWILGSLCLALGVRILFDHPIVAIPAFLLGIVLLPVTSYAVHRWTGRRVHVVAKVVVAFVLLTSMAYLYPREEIRRIKREKQMLRAEITLEYENNRASILSAVREAIDARKYAQAIDQAKPYLDSRDPELLDLYDLAREKRIVEQLKGIPVKEYQLNKELYSQLITIRPENSKYREKYEFYADKVQSLQNRASQIRHQFSAWNGAHRNLERYIKERMHNPDSYKHVETRYWDMGPHLVVSTTFRGTNAFGAIVTTRVKAKISLSGEVLEIMDWM